VTLRCGADDTVSKLKVRKAPCRARSWANFSLLYGSSCIPTGMHGPTRIFWAELTPRSRARRIR
jgi:hypothetical protein